MCLVISGSPGRQSRREYLCRSKPSVARDGARWGRGFPLWLVAVAAEGALHAVGIGHGDHEIVNAGEAAFDLLAGGESDGGGGGRDVDGRGLSTAEAAAAARNEPCLLERAGIG